MRDVGMYAAVGQKTHQVQFAASFANLLHGIEKGLVGKEVPFLNAEVDAVNSNFDLGIDIGGGVGVIFVNTNVFPRGANEEHEFTIPINGFALDTFITNGGKIMLRSDGSDTVSLYGATFYISVDHQPV